MTEEAEPRAGGVRTVADAAPERLGAVDGSDHRVLPTGVGELDRVLGGGLVAGAATLVGGPPGIGKSTLLLQAAAGLARRHGPVLYVSAEESLAQVRQRADRLRAVHDDLWVTAASELGQIAGQLDRVQPVACIVDSVQTVNDPSIGSAPGSVAQVRDSAQWLVHQARARSAAMVLVGHVTKEGTLAGPRVLEHVVDTVVSFDGDGHHALRMLRVGKHRHGPTGELGVLEMTGRGLIDVADAERALPGRPVRRGPGFGRGGHHRRRPTTAGRAPVVGRRQLIARAAPVGSGGGCQPALGPPGRAPTARRRGMRRARCLRVGRGRARVVEPGADLGLCLAVASSLAGVTLPGDLMVCGEVGLAGELRRPVGIERRLAEAERVGFRAALVPATVEPGRSPLHLIRVGSVSEALEQVLGPTYGPSTVDLMRGSSA